MNLVTLCLSLTALWGLDRHGRFVSPNDDSCCMVDCSSDASDVRERVLVDLAAVENLVQKEVSILRTYKSKRDRQHRLLYLFQCDLLPGLSGRILDLKMERDAEAHYNDGISLWVKMLGYAFVFGVNACMLFYVFLFALRQTKARQDAWFRSFLIWLGLDTILVCTLVVLVSNIVIPTYITKDLSKLKDRLVSTFRAYRQTIGGPSSSNRANGNSENDEKSEKTHGNTGSEFNSADFFFVSNRISRMAEFKQLPAAPMVSTFTTQWPKQSYQQVQEDSSSSYQSLVMGVRSVVVFAIAGFIKLPPSLQDSVVYMTFSTVCGYIIVLLTQLYSIHPSLIAIPVVTGIVLTQYIIRFITAARDITTTEDNNVKKDDSNTQNMESVEPMSDPGKLPTRKASLQEAITTTQVSSITCFLYRKDNEQCSQEEIVQLDYPAAMDSGVLNRPASQVEPRLPRCTV